MSSQIKRLQVFTKNHSARIRQTAVNSGTTITATTGRDDGFVVEAYTDRKGRNSLCIENVFEGGREGVVLSGTQIRTLKRILDRHGL
jgi:hypothetical protein